MDVSGRLLLSLRGSMGRTHRCLFEKQGGDTAWLCNHRERQELIFSLGLSKRQ